MQAGGSYFEWKPFASCKYVATEANVCQFTGQPFQDIARSYFSFSLAAYSKQVALF